jgi:hypothetical protein
MDACQGADILKVTNQEFTLERKGGRKVTLRKVNFVLHMITMLLLRLLMLSTQRPERGLRVFKKQMAKRLFRHRGEKIRTLDETIQ